MTGKDLFLMSRDGSAVFAVSPAMRGADGSANKGSSSRRVVDKRELDMKDTKGLRETGFTLVEIMIVIAIIGLLAAIAIPNFMKARATSQSTACINNLRQIDSAAHQFALIAGKKTGDGITYPADLTPYIKLNADNSIPPCPAGGVYTCATVGNEPTCSLSANTTPPHILQ
jgi:prepilin-type N-terminal cleavage/methylation domain-containing protein